MFLIVRRFAGLCIQIEGEDSVNFCGLLRKHKLYVHQVHAVDIFNTCSIELTKKRTFEVQLKLNVVIKSMSYTADMV